MLVTSPQDGELWKALSVAQQMLGEDALPALERALALRPHDAELAANLGALLAGRGLWEPALAAYQQALTLQPRLAGAHNNLGNALLALGRPAEALSAFDTALALQPGLAAALGNRGRALLALQSHAEAARAFEQAAAARPGDVGLRAHAATAWAAAGEVARALACQLEAAALAPGDTAHRFVLGNLLLESGDVAGAVEAWETVLALDAGHAEAACNLALARPERGEAVLSAVLAAGLDDERGAVVLGNRGGLRLRQGRFGDAVADYREALHRAPASPLAMSHLAQALKQCGELDEADGVLSRLIEREPGLLSARSDRLLLRAYRQHGVQQAPALRAEAEDFGRVAAQPAVTRPARAGGGWRVGLVSADLRAHPVGRLAEAWLPALARRCDLFVYAGHGRGDALTRRLSGVVSRWRDVHNLDDASLAQLVAADGVDVLLDLHGHTGGHRLGVFARRAAPRQFSWLGYAGSTGLQAMDGFIGDRWLLPDGAGAGFVEPLLRLPHSFTVYAPPADAPAVQRRDGPLSFGCFNALHKLSD